MKNNYVTKVRLLVFMFFCSFLSWGQAILPVTRTAWTGAEPLGWSQISTTDRTTISACTGNDASIFDATADATTVFFSGTPQTLTFKLKKQGMSGAVSKMAVEESVDGVSWTLIGNYGAAAPQTIITDCADISTSLLSTSRYVKWTYTKGTGNCDLDDVNITALASSNTIATSAIAGSPFCVTSSTGASVSVPFTSVGTFTGNTYTAQLSNAAGSFAAPTNIGTLVSNANSGTISATIPANTATGTGYLIRVISNGPTVTGTNNGTNLTVNLGAVTIAPTTTQNIAVAANGTLLTATESAGVISRQWYYGTASGGPYSTAISGATTTTYTPNFAIANTYYVVCVSTYSCGTATSNQVQINVSAGLTNDLCTTATALVINAAPVSGTLVSSTFTAPFTKKDVWFTFTPTCNGSHTITVSGFTGDVDIELFSGACPATTTTLDGSAGTTSTETITLALTAGTTYYLRVLAFNVAAETATFNASVTSTSELQISNAGSPGIGNVTIGSNNVVIMGFMTTPNCATSYSISSVTLGAAAVATATTADVSNFRIVYDINGNGIVDGGETSVSGGGIALGTTMLFTLSGQTGIVGDRRYLLVADISATATNGRTIKINLTPSTNLVATLVPAGTVLGTALGNTQTIVPPVCTAAVISSVTPASGSVGTEVTITASSGNLTGALASFSGVSATVVSSSATQLVVLIPSGATTGNLVISDTQPCNAVVAYTVLTSDTSACEGLVSDLIIYEVYDEQRNSGGTIVLFNGTNTTKVLSNYRIFRASNYGGTYTNFATMTGSIAPGATGTVKVAASDCGAAATNGSLSGGFNDLDGLQLRLSDGVTVVDDVAAPNFIGYYLKRNNGALTPNTTYNAPDWTLVDVGEVPVGTNECLPFATPPTGIGSPPAVTTHPTYSPSCGSTSAVLSAAGTEGFVGGNALAYQWFFAAPGSATWTAVADGGIYSGATTASLNISNVTGVVNYQYYCQIRENSATCYSASNAVKVTDTNGTTWNGATWSNGLPSLTKAAIIDGTYVTATNGNFSCCSLIVNATRTLTISSGGYVEVQNDITTNGILDVLNNGSLVQISDTGVNTGNIRYNRTANVRRQDYVYWSTPVAGFANSAVSPGTNLGYQYKWLPTTAGINNFGNWTLANETMVLGKGYCLRAPDAFSLTTLANYTATFTGVPNNGVVTIPISRGTWNGGTYATGVSSTLGTNEDDNWNLVGNPYPSAIHAINFLTLNPNIDGFVNIWTHGTLPSSSITDPFYNDYAYNYTSADYITYNAAGASSGPGVFNGRIGGGQGFFVSMLHTTGATTENLIFNNSLRNISYNNGQFFRSATATTSPDDAEKHRIWFDLVTPTGTSFRSLLAYAEGATNGKDRLFDAFSNEKLSFHIFSLVENEKMLIQGRTLPFDDTDKVNIGVTLPQDGLYKIALAAVDGLFANPSQNIYLEDKLLHVIYDLRSAPYSFMGNKGTIKDRFIIRYKNSEVLANDSFTTNNDVVVISNQELSVTSTKEKIANIIVFDVLGRKLYESKEVNANYFALPVQKRDAPLFIEIVLEDGTKVNKKTVY